MYDQDYVVSYTQFYGTICAIVRANDEDGAIAKMKQVYPVDEKYPPKIV